MRLHIRNVTPADLDAVLELERACFSEETAATRDAFVYRISAFPERFFVADLFHSRLNNDFYYINTVDGLHYSRADHAKLAPVVVGKIREMLE